MTSWEGITWHLISVTHLLPTPTSTPTSPSPTSTHTLCHTSPPTCPCISHLLSSLYPLLVPLLLSAPSIHSHHFLSSLLLSPLSILSPYPLLLSPPSLPIPLYLLLLSLSSLQVSTLNYSPPLLSHSLITPAIIAGREEIGQQYFITFTQQRQQSCLLPVESVPAHILARRQNDWIKRFPLSGYFQTAVDKFSLDASEFVRSLPSINREK